MIKERFMVIAKGAAADKGKTFKGYLYKVSLENPRTFMYAFENINCPDIVEINPSTVEPVEIEVVKMEGFYFCPNCKQDFSNDPTYKWNYCPECGQRLDWSVE